MALPSNHFKLGLFVLVVLAGGLAIVIGLGAASLHKQTVAYHTYFNESVQGLDVGAPVKFRGVTIGSVSAVGIAPDHRHVDVVESIDVDEIRRMGLLAAQDGTTSLKSFTRQMMGTERFLVPPDLRAQLGSQGITGVKFISIDFFDAAANPAPSLPFPVPETYIPAAPSVFKNLEDTVTKAMEKLPQLISEFIGVALRLDNILGDVQEQGVVHKASRTLEHTDDLVGSLRGVVAQLERAKLPDKLGSSFDQFATAIGTLNGILERVGGDAGLVASLRRASDAIGSFGRGAGVATHDLDQTLREVREAAESIRHFTEDLDQEPDMLIKGRAKAKHSSEGHPR